MEKFNSISNLPATSQEEMSSFSVDAQGKEVYNVKDENGEVVEQVDPYANIEAIEHDQDRQLAELGEELNGESNDESVAS